MKRFLAGLLVLLLLAANAEAATYTYGFGADENPLSDSGAWEGGYTGFGNMQVASGALWAAAAESDERMTVSTIAPTNNQYAQVKIGTWDTAVYIMGWTLLLRYASPPTATGVEVTVVYINGDNTYLVVTERSDGTPNELYSAPTTAAAGDIWKAVLVGTELTVYRDSGAGFVQIHQMTVGGPNGGRIGLGLYDTDATPNALGLDDFEGGDYGVTPPVVTVRHRPILIQ